MSRALPRAPAPAALAALAAVLGIAALLGIAAPAAAQESPYAGWQTRAIKALSPEEIASLEAGEGMGFALTAELNGWPGPRHVLELADSLELTADQAARVEEIRAQMRGEAVLLGKEIVAAEAALDAAFADRSISEPELVERTAEIARLEGELRAVHLAAHLATAAVLTREQIARYGALRGYENNHGGHVHE